MATEQLPASQYIIGGQLTLTGYILPTHQYGIVEDTEDKQTAAGQFKCAITYSRRQTLNVTLEVTHGNATPSVYTKGGTIASGVFADSQGSATAWKIQNVTEARSRGVPVITLDLVALTDMLA
jgi:hypothetical protein